MSPETTALPAAAMSDRERVITIAAAIACISVAGIGLSLIAPLISLLLSAQGISATAIGAQTAFASFAGIITSPFVPPLAHRFGLRNFLLATLAVGTFTLCLFPVLPDFWLWGGLRFILASAINALFVLSEFWINAAAPEARRGLVMGIYATALSVGFAAGPALLVVNGGAGMLLFIVGALFFAAAAIPIFFAGAHAPILEGKSRQSVWRFLMLAPVATIAALVYGAAEQSSFAFMTLYGEAIHLTQGDSALLLTLFGLGNVASQIPLGLLSDKCSRPILLLACALISMAASAAMPFYASDWLVLASLVFITGGVAGGIYTVGLAHLGAHFSGTSLATANATFVMLYAIGMMVSTPLMGLMVDLIHPHGFAIGFAAMFGAYAMLIIVRFNRETR